MGSQSREVVSLVESLNVKYKYIHKQLKRTT